MSWRLRCEWSLTPRATSASRVRMLIGKPSTTCVPRVSTTTMSGAAARSAPAITERAALPVQRVTTSGIAGGAYAAPTRPSDRASTCARSERFHTEIDWLDSWHSFSFGPHYDPANTHHGLLLVSNDDVVRAGRGFGTHSHRDMEIVTWVLDGELEHRDSTGTVGIIYPGLAQRMSAGSGIQHSETNASATADVHLVQMWVAPRHRGDRARLRAARRQRRARAVASSCRSRRADPAKGGVKIHQRDAELLAGRLAPGVEVDGARRRRTCTCSSPSARPTSTVPARSARATRCGSPTRGRSRSPPGPTACEVLVWATA